MANALKRVGLSWWREGLGGGVVPPAPPSQSRNDAEIARVAALTEHFTRIVALDPSRPAVLRGPKVEPHSRVAEFQYRGPDLTRTLPADLKARLRCSGARRALGPPTAERGLVTRNARLYASRAEPPARRRGW